MRNRQPIPTPGDSGQIRARATARSAARPLALKLSAVLALFLAHSTLGSKAGFPAWPPPPDEPYITYVRSISGPADVGAKPATLSRLASWVIGGLPDSAGLVKPFGLALDEAGNLLVTDTGAGAVCCLDPSRKKWLRWESIGKTRFQIPVAIARSGQTFFVADSGLGKVIAFSEKGKLLFEVTRELERPSGLATHADRLFIADAQRHQIVVFDTRGVYQSKFGQRGGAPGEFNYPTHVATDASGRVYVTDSLNYRVQVFDAAGKFERVIGSAGDGPGHFSRPKGVATDQSGHVYIVDALFDNVQIFDGAGRLLLNWGEAGSDPGQFWLPNAIVINRQNEIFVADSYNHRIQVFQYTGKP